MSLKRTPHDLQVQLAHAKLTGAIADLVKVYDLTPTDVVDLLTRELQTTVKFMQKRQGPR